MGLTINADSVNDVVEANSLLHGQEAEVWGAAKRPDAQQGVRWNIAMRPGKRKLLDKTQLGDKLTDQLERIKASIRAKVGQSFLAAGTAIFLLRFSGQRRGNFHEPNKPIIGLRDEGIFEVGRGGLLLRHPSHHS